MKGCHRGAGPGQAAPAHQVAELLPARAVPVKLLMEPVPVALQGVSWET